MRSLQRNKRKLYYSVYDKKIPIYETDENGNVLYTEIDGKKVPIVIEERAGYCKPVIFYANISAARGDSQSDPFGISLDYTKSIATTELDLPITEGTLIWQKSEPKYNVDETVNDLSAEYRVVAVAESLNSVVYAVKALQKG